MAPHLVIAVSAHGFGHIGQTAPVLQALKARLSHLKITVRSAAPTFKIIERFGADTDLQTVNLDIGMVQQNALEVMTDETAAAYKTFHDIWPERVATEAKALAALQPDLVLANIPYLSLAAAAKSNIPAIALCSLNWADIYRYYYKNLSEADKILNEMLSAYNSALHFLQPEPSMPMPGITNGQSIGPIAQLGISRRSELMQKIGAAFDERIVMISLGGMDARLPIEKWSNLLGLHLIVPAAWNLRHPRFTSFEDLQMPFADVMASCDALIAKPGYGSFVEAACLGLPVLYLERSNWPEAPYLVSWLEEHGCCLQLQSQHIESANIRYMLEKLWVKTAKAITPSGIDEAVDYIANFLN